MTKQESNTPALPEGFEQVSDGNLAEEWDFSKHDMLIGVCKRVKLVDCVQQGKPAKANMMLVEAHGTGFCVWESAGLKDLFTEAQPGDEVYIKYDGVVKMDGGRNDMKKFITAINTRGRQNVTAS